MVSVTAGSMGRYLEPAEVAQVVQLHQDDTWIRIIARRFAVSPSKEHGEDSRSQAFRAGEGCWDS